MRPRLYQCGARSPCSSHHLWSIRDDSVGFLAPKIALMSDRFRGEQIRIDFGCADRDTDRAHELAHCEESVAEIFHPMPAIRDLECITTEAPCEDNELHYPTQHRQIRQSSGISPAHSPRDRSNLGHGCSLWRDRADNGTPTDPPRRFTTTNPCGTREDASRLRIALIFPARPTQPAPRLRQN